MDIYLVRHGVAHERDASRWPDDGQRPLTSEGMEKFRGVARALGGLENRVGQVFCSPLTRAWQTAELLESEARWPEPTSLPELAPESSPPETLEALVSRDGVGGMRAIAMVGHRPSMHELASYMLCADPGGIEIKIKKGGVVVLRFDGRVEPGAAALRALIPPRLLLSMV